MSDATIRYLLSLDPGTQDKVVAQLKALGVEAGKSGQAMGQGVTRGLAAAKGGFQAFMDSWGHFLVKGEILARTWRGTADVIKGAADSASKRLSDWNQKNNAFTSEAFKRQSAGTTLRLLGINDAGTRERIQDKLGSINPLFRQQAEGDFNRIAATLARRKDLDPQGLSKALEEAAAGLGRRGHIAGFGESYAALASAPGLAKGADLTDLATGLIMRRSRLSEEQDRAVGAGLENGQLQVDGRGNLTAGKDASQELRDAVREMMAAGGISLAARGMPEAMRGLDPDRIGGAWDSRAALDQGLDFTKPSDIPEDKPSGKAEFGDYLSAAMNNTIAQQAAFSAATVVATAALTRLGLASAATAAQVAAKGAGTVAPRAAAGLTGRALGVLGRGLSMVGGIASLLTAWQEGGMGQDEEDAQILQSQANAKRKPGVEPPMTAAERERLVKAGAERRLNTKAAQAWREDNPIRSALGFQPDAEDISEYRSKQSYDLIAQAIRDGFESLRPLSSSETAQ